MGWATVTRIPSLTVHRLTEAVTVMRLMETPAVEDWDEILEALNREAFRCELLVLRGPGWLGDSHARSMTKVAVQSMRIQGLEIATETGSPVTV